MITEEAVKKLEADVVHEARKLRAANPHMTWVYALEYTAGILCQGWEWRVDEFVGASDENAIFMLTVYNP